jgi:hypothetical protein
MGMYPDTSHSTHQNSLGLTLTEHTSAASQVQAGPVGRECTSAAGFASASWAGGSGMHICGWLRQCPVRLARHCMLFVPCTSYAAFPCYRRPVRVARHLSAIRALYIFHSTYARSVPCTPCRTFACHPCLGELARHLQAVCAPHAGSIRPCCVLSEKLSRATCGNMATEQVPAEESKSRCAWIWTFAENIHISRRTGHIEPGKICNNSKRTEY